MDSEFVGGTWLELGEDRRQWNRKWMVGVEVEVELVAGAGGEKGSGCWKVVACWKDSDSLGRRVKGSCCDFGFGFGFEC